MRHRHSSARRWPLWLALLAWWASPAAAADSFDALAAQAWHGDLAMALDVLLRNCDGERDDRDRRVCEQVVRARTVQLKAQPLLAAVDPPEITPGPHPGSRTLALTGCLLCSPPPVLDGVPRQVTAAEPAPPPPPPSADGRRPRAPPHAPPPVRDTASQVRPIDRIVVEVPPAMSEEEFDAVLARLRTEVIVELSDPRSWQQGELSGVAVQVLAWRVADPCRGTIYLSRPPSKAALPTSDDPSCDFKPRRPPPPPPAPTVAERLTTRDIEQALEPVRRHARTCFARFRIRGRLDLALDVRPDGTVKMVRSSGPLTDTPTAQCVRGAALRLRFPPFRSHTSLHVVYPVLLR